MYIVSSEDYRHTRSKSETSNNPEAVINSYAHTVRARRREDFP